MTEENAHKEVVTRQQLVTPSGSIIEILQGGQASELADADSAVLATMLRHGGPVDDSWFDRIYEAAWRVPSAVHWSSTRVVQRIVNLLAPKKGETVLDVGSGVGKFCLVGSLLSAADFVGVERRSALVDVAQRAQRKLGAHRASFIFGDALDIDWRPFHCIHLYNPFEEHLMPESSRIDSSVAFSEAEYATSVRKTKEQLETLRPGTRVAVHWGFGGEMPNSFALIHSEQFNSSQLELWRKGP